MPIVKATIEGREYSFAPLQFGEWEQYVDEVESKPSPSRLVRTWLPRIASSMKRAGSEMPDVRAMDMDQANVVLNAMILAVLKASGMSPGEAAPDAA